MCWPLVYTICLKRKLDKQEEGEDGDDETTRYKKRNIRCHEERHIHYPQQMFCNCAMSNSLSIVEPVIRVLSETLLKKNSQTGNNISWKCFYKHKILSFKTSLNIFYKTYTRNNFFPSIHSRDCCPLSCLFQLVHNLRSNSRWQTWKMSNFLHGWKFQSKFLPQKRVNFRQNQFFDKVRKSSFLIIYSVSRWKTLAVEWHWWLYLPQPKVDHYNVFGPWVKYPRKITIRASCLWVKIKPG